MSVCTLTKESYADVEKWYSFFNSGKSLDDIPYDSSWVIMFSNLKNNEKYKKLNKRLKEVVLANKHIKIYPFPSYVFKAFSITPANNVKVVFIGQDPYFNCESHNNKHVPQAMGLSFSVPHNIKIPSSLDNIYENLIKYKHIKEKPDSGNLWFWAHQGCLMLNTALTVEDGAKESHLKLWDWFTDYIIKYISDYMEGVIFVIWGAHAFKKNNLIDGDKHHTIVSSHPSGYSANKPFQNYPAFMNVDHFGIINETLKKMNKETIMW